MYHSIQIIPAEGWTIRVGTVSRTDRMQGKNTWDDWHLIPSSRPLFSPPAQKTNFLDVPGMSGSIDLSTALSDNYPVYSDRTGSNEFYVMNGYKEWYNAYSDIMNYCHGQYVKLILEDEPDYYYIGRVSVNSWKSDKDYSKIVLDYTLDPYKYEIVDSTEPWRWNPFSFVDGIITEADVWGEGVICSTSTNDIIRQIPVRSAPTCPEFIITPQSTPGNNCKLHIYLYYYPTAATSAEVYDPDTTYNKGDHAWYPTENGMLYECKSDSTKNKVPTNTTYWSEDLKQITNKEFTFTESDKVTKIIPEMVLRDYTFRYAYHGTKPTMGLRFVCAQGAEFDVKVKFRRGKL